MPSLPLLYTSSPPRPSCVTSATVITTSATPFLHLVCSDSATPAHENAYTPTSALKGRCHHFKVLLVCPACAQPWSSKHHPRIMCSMQSTDEWMNVVFAHAVCIEHLAGRAALGLSLEIVEDSQRWRITKPVLFGALSAECRAMRYKFGAVRPPILAAA